MTSVTKPQQLNICLAAASILLILIMAFVSTKLVYHGIRHGMAADWESTVTPLVNVALQSKGASVIEWPKEYTPATIYLFGVRMPEIFIKLKSDPKTLLQPDSPGFFQFPGCKGSIIIDLSKEILISAVSLKRSTNSILSQPKDFSILGSKDLVEWIEMGTYVFLLSGEDARSFSFNPSSVRYVKLVMTSNWGDIDFTSLNSISVYSKERAASSELRMKLKWLKLNSNSEEDAHSIASKRQ